MIIYLAKNKIDGKVYIGKTTKTLEERMIQHLTSNKSYFHKSLRKYGKENFIWTILEQCYSEEELNEKEIWYIKHYDSVGKKGYNLTYGGEGGTPSDETKKKISETCKQNGVGKWMGDGRSGINLGKITSEETKMKISISHKGLTPWKWKKFSEEHIKNLSESHKGLESGMKGKKHTDESKRKISESKKGKQTWNKGKVLSEETKMKISETLKNRKNNK